MATHELKVWPLYYNRIVHGYKTVELRKDDRGYQPGDTLVLHEWIPEVEMYTGRSCERQVTDIVRDGPWLADGYVAMSIRDERKTLVDKQRLEALERLYEAVKNWRHGLIDKVMGKDIGYIASTYPAIFRLAETFDELEATNDVVRPDGVPLP